MKQTLKCLFLMVCSLQLFNAIQIKHPTILIYTLVRNKARILPYFLSHLENIDYPKDRISLWFRTDRNEDDSAEILKKWVTSVRDRYHAVQFDYRGYEEPFPGETSPGHWTDKRFEYMMKSREEALNFARRMWADYVWAIDADVLLGNSNILNYLISKNATVVAPMLTSESLYSNFWHGWTQDYYYQRTDEYKPILYRERSGCFPVPMIHSCVLINLNHLESDSLSYIPENIKDYDGPRDDIIAFAISARRSGIPMYICNEYNGGYITIPLEKEDTLEMDKNNLINIKMNALADGYEIIANSIFKSYISTPKTDTLGFDKIYVINLVRRPERRKRMMSCMNELGIKVEVFDAIDGRNLGGAILKNITFLSGYEDPYHKRPMTFGEIGCFLSHYNIWQRVVHGGYDKVLVLEDDIRFEPFFRAKLLKLVDDLARIRDWDLVYLGRKRLEDSDSEKPVEDLEHIVRAGYSYWTLGYALSLRGARKLLAGEPLRRLLPVDEYIPIMSDRHPRRDWKEQFPHRDLVVLSTSPLLLYPIRYTGEEGYISDTEDSGVVKGLCEGCRDDL